ncbi:MAG: ABC transporter substrate-binding protein [Bdellovibrionota bacterium]|nr:MAG: ABC transporter substrate-binding protein [Bdellovibrionota bacterium]
MTKAAIFAITLFFVLLSGSVQAEDRIKIGVSVALTGNAATYGTDIKNTLLFANDKLAGGRYELIIEDDMCEGKTGISVAHKLVNVDKVKYVLGYACSSSLLASAKVYEENKVIAIASSAAAADISQAGDYIFRTVASNDDIGKLLFDYIAARHKHFAVLSEETDFSQGLLKSFLKNNSANNVDVVSENFFTNEADFRSLFLRLQGKKVDGLFINSQTEATFLMALKAAHESRFNAQIYSAYMAGSATFRQNAGVLAEGIIFADRPTAADVFTAEGKDLLEEFKARYKLNGWEIMFAATFEAFRALHQAIQSGDDVRHYLYNTQFHGLFGDYTFDANGDIQGLKFFMKVIKGGQVHNLGQ